MKYKRRDFYLIEDEYQKFKELLGYSVSAWMRKKIKEELREYEKLESRYGSQDRR